jgi:histidinol phosphatase-like PHP family hydrolase
MDTPRQWIIHMRRKLKVIADMHIHSIFSVDGKDNMITMCRAAVDRGRRVCFGSDAHSAAEIGAGLERAQDLASQNRLEAGIFQQRRFHPFDRDDSCQ